MALILVIEDALLTRTMLKKALQSLEHSVLEAGNGLQGLEILEKHQPDCIFVDLLMPEIDGWQFLTTLQQQNNTIPVFVVSADIQKTSRQRCLELGAWDVLNKPPRQDQLKEAIAKALRIKEEIQ
jgi:CheY-like chemotaxis protein